MDNNLLNDSAWEAMQLKIKLEIEEAFEFAENSDFPTAEASRQFKYAKTNAQWLKENIQNQFKEVVL